MKAKKSYGQHFLNSERIARRIADSLFAGSAGGRALEVGPGRGMLTQFLLERGLDLIVVEADRDMVDHLQAHFPALRGRIRHADFLRLPLDDVFGGEPFGLIGNFPYNISSQILFHMLDFRRLIPEMVGMFQKEVAERVIAGPGSKTYGVISVLIQAYYSGEYLFGVDRTKFNPPPQVQSAVIRLTRREQLRLDCDEALFRRVVKTTFGQRRKMLRNTLREFIADPAVLADPQFTRRPEQLSVADFIELTRRVEGLQSGT